MIDRALPLSTLAANVARITNKPVLYAFDAVSMPETQNAMYDLVAPGGSLIIDRRSEIGEAKLATGKKYVALVSGDAQNPHSRECAKALYAHATELFASGEIKVRRCLSVLVRSVLKQVRCSPTGLKSCLADWRE